MVDCIHDSCTLQDNKHNNSQYGVAEGKTSARAQTFLSWDVTIDHPSKEV